VIDLRLEPNALEQRSAGTAADFGFEYRVIVAESAE
jgi:hypothetical protein